MSSLKKNVSIRRNHIQMHGLHQSIEKIQLKLNSDTITYNHQKQFNTKQFLSSQFIFANKEIFRCFSPFLIFRINLSRIIKSKKLLKSRKSFLIQLKPLNVPQSTLAKFPNVKTSLNASPILKIRCHRNPDRGFEKFFLRN